jgi:hypothetical protein
MKYKRGLCRGRPAIVQARVPLVFEHPIVGDVKTLLLGVRAQRRRLRADRLVFLLPGPKRPGRRSPRWSCCGRPS